MKIALCDDDIHCRVKLLDLMNEYCVANPDKNIVFSIYESAETLLNVIEKTGKFDLYILDIVMCGINGIDLGLSLRRMGHDGKIIYLTNSIEFALDAFKARAYHYMLKPIKKEEFFSILTETTDLIASHKTKSLLVKTKDGTIKIDFDNIMYAELCRRVITYHLINGKSINSITIRTPFSEAVHELLLDNRFSLCGAGMIVNLHHITSVEAELIQCKNSYKVYLSKKACRDIRSAWYDFWFDKEV